MINQCTDIYWDFVFVFSFFWSFDRDTGLAPLAVGWRRMSNAREYYPLRVTTFLRATRIVIQIFIRRGSFGTSLHLTGIGVGWGNPGLQEGIATRCVRPVRHPRGAKSRRGPSVFSLSFLREIGNWDFRWSISSPLAKETKINFFFIYFLFYALYIYVCVNVFYGRWMSAYQNL